MHPVHAATGAARGAGPPSGAESGGAAAPLKAGHHGAGLDVPSDGPAGRLPAAAAGVPYRMLHARLSSLAQPALAQQQAGPRAAAGHACSRQGSDRVLRRAHAHDGHVPSGTCLYGKLPNSLQSMTWTCMSPLADAQPCSFQPHVECSRLSEHHVRSKGVADTVSLACVQPEDALPVTSQLQYFVQGDGLPPGFLPDLLDGLEEDAIVTIGELDICRSMAPPARRQHAVPAIPVLATEHKAADRAPPGAAQKACCRHSCARACTAPPLRPVPTAVVPAVLETAPTCTICSCSPERQGLPHEKVCAGRVSEADGRPEPDRQPQGSRAGRRELTLVARERSKSQVSRQRSNGALLWKAAWRV